MADSAESIRVATWNIHRGAGRDGTVDHERIVAVLQEISADVIALQEVAYRSGESENTLSRYAAAIGAEAVEGITLLDERGHYGNAVLTRLPVLRLRRHDISCAGREPRGAIDLSLGCGENRGLRLVATHLGLRAGERREQTRRLAQLFGDGPSGVDVLLGDLNEWFPGSRPMRTLRRIFGPGPAPATFPVRRPVAALDRIWVRPVSTMVKLRVHSSRLARTASDHLPLVAELAL